MSAAADHSYTKADVERLVNDLVPPIVERSVDRAISRVQSTLAQEIAKGVAAALHEQNLRLGVDATTPAGIREAQKRNMHVDQWIAGMPEVQRRWDETDRLLRDFTAEDQAWVRECRRRSESDARTLRETVIRWVVPALLGLMIASMLFYWREDTHPTTPAALVQAVAAGR